MTPGEVLAWLGVAFALFLALLLGVALLAAAWVTIKGMFNPAKPEDKKQDSVYNSKDPE